MANNIEKNILTISQTEFNRIGMELVMDDNFLKNPKLPELSQPARLITSMLGVIVLNELENKLFENIGVNIDEDKASDSLPQQGDNVVFINKSHHESLPHFCPPTGTKGKVIRREDDGVRVRWEDNPTTFDNITWVPEYCVKIADQEVPNGL